MKLWFRTHLFEILDVLKFIGIIVLVLMFIRFNTAVAENAKVTRENTSTTREVVQSQGAILEAIKQLSIDTKVSNEQKTNIIICMLQVPVGQRTTNTLNNCRKQGEVTSAAPTTTQPSSSTLSSTKSSNTTSTPPPQAQPRGSQSSSLFSRIIKILGL